MIIMAAILKLINNDPPGGRWRDNTAAAGSAAKDFEVEVVILNKSQAGPDAKAPAVYLNDKLLAEVKGIRDGKITEQELVDEMTKAGVPGRKGKSSCSCCCG